MCISRDYKHLQCYIRWVSRGKILERKMSVEAVRGVQACNANISSICFQSFLESEHQRRSPLHFLLQFKAERSCIFELLPLWRNHVLVMSKRWPGIFSSTQSKQSFQWIKILYNLHFLLWEALAIVVTCNMTMIEGGTVDFRFGDNPNPLPLHDTHLLYELQIKLLQLHERPTQTTRGQLKCNFSADMFKAQGSEVYFRV